MTTSIALYIVLAGAIFFFVLLAISLKSLTRKNAEIATLRYKVKDLESKVFENGRK